MRPRQSLETPGVIAPPPLIYAAGVGAGFALEAILPSPSLPAAFRVVLGGALLAAGLGLQGSFIALFRRARTPVAPYQPTTALVTDGPYRLTRNPGYLGFALIAAAIGFLADAVWVLAPLPVVLAIVHRGVVLREERYLEQLFGERYLAYKARTRRWL